MSRPPEPQDLTPQFIRPAFESQPEQQLPKVPNYRLPREVNSEAEPGLEPHGGAGGLFGQVVRIG
jgi:hypothetical protein